MAELFEWFCMTLIYGWIVLVGTTAFIFLVIVPFVWLAVTLKDAWDNL